MRRKGPLLGLLATTVALVALAWVYGRQVLGAAAPAFGPVAPWVERVQESSQLYLRLLALAGLGWLACFYLLVRPTAAPHDRAGPGRFARPPTARGRSGRMLPY